ncbi:hypothetical protein ATANTOWER_003976 [Ataeniobius toweri]|uniref:Uncharacterized protein n=1 Tax=Ataeniobius toweri TaxID=208326 RepID=A0ABU7CEH0_9TELE|nr:hypothetical protein [Ataeniobius toweri]
MRRTNTPNHLRRKPAPQQQPAARLSPGRAWKTSSIPSNPTFDGDDMLPDLVLQQRLLHPLQQLVDGVDVRVHGLEPLDLGSDGGRVGQMQLIVHPDRGKQWSNNRFRLSGSAFTSSKNRSTLIITEKPLPALHPRGR